MACRGPHKRVEHIASRRAPPQPAPSPKAQAQTGGATAGQATPLTWDQLPFGRCVALRALKPRRPRIKSRDGWGEGSSLLATVTGSFNSCCRLLVCSRAFGRVFPLPACCPLTLGAPRPSVSISCCPNPWAGLLSWILQERSLSEKVLQECQYCSLSWKERSPFDRWGSENRGRRFSDFFDFHKCWQAHHNPEGDKCGDPSCLARGVSAVGSERVLKPKAY